MARINCHSAFKHYEMFHGHKACGGGNYGSIFNTTYNVNCGGSHSGGFWGGVGIGLGAAIGNLFGGFGFGGFGMGGFGFPSFGGFGMGGFGFPGIGGGWFGGGASKASKECKCDCDKNAKKAKENDSKEKDDKATVEPEKVVETKVNNDYDNLIALHTRKNELLGVNRTTPATKEELVALKNDIEALNKDGALDGVQDLEDKNYIEQLLKGLDERIKEAEKPAPNYSKDIDDATTPEELGKIPQDKLTEEEKEKYNKKKAELNDKAIWGGLTWNDVPASIDGLKVPAKAKAPSDDELKTLTAENFDVVHDTGDPADVDNTKDFKVSNQKYGNTQAPLYLMVQDNGGQYNYKCVGQTSAGHYVYTTPNTDSAKNVYTLIIDENGKFRLHQENGYSGYNKADDQLS